MGKVSRYQFIRGKRGARKRQQELEQNVVGKIIKRVNDTVQRIVKTVSNEGAIPVLQSKPLSDEGRANLLKRSNVVKRLKVVKADYYLLKQKNKSLENALKALDENSEIVLSLKIPLRDQIRNIIKVPENFNIHDFTKDEIGWIVAIDNLNDDYKRIGLGHMITILTKLGQQITINCEPQPITFG